MLIGTVNGMSALAQEFVRRLDRIPPHGLGLSVDVYSPNLFDLLAELDACGVRYGYLEIFKAAQSALTEVRRRLTHVPLAYHAEGIWLTQPDWTCPQAGHRDLDEVALHLATLGSYWINHECATKQMAGVSFGTYLPPLFTAESARMTANHALQFQRALTASSQFPAGEEPLLLLEIPPLTYFAFGDLSVTRFFQSLADQSPCGFVFDLGHAWTYYRYTNEWRHRSLESFFAEFLDAFPLDRVVQIHMAGLAVHESEAGTFDKSRMPSEPPRWLDAHHAPIPDILWDMLEQVLAHPHLRALKGVALEVDTKSISQTTRELTRAQSRIGHRLPTVRSTNSQAIFPGSARSGADEGSTLMNLDEAAVDQLRRQYDRYARVVSGNIAVSEAHLPSAWIEPEAIDVYRRQYLPYEILTWGGNLRDMFPETSRRFLEAGMDIAGFVEFWFEEQHQATDESYDFFLFKLDRFPAYVVTVLPEVGEVARQESRALKTAYTTACEVVGSF